MRRTLTTGFAVAMLLWSAQAMATPAAPNITDGPGDANLVNGQGKVPGHEQGHDARPASIDGADLRAAWFETAYETIQIIDPDSGDVVRLEHRPTALIVRIQTQGPIHPTTPPGSSLNFEVLADLEDCRASFRLWAKGTGPANDEAILNAVTNGCGAKGPGSGAVSQIRPAFQGNEVTLTFPFDGPDISPFIANGERIRQPSAHSELIAPFASPILDETFVGTDFVIGEDVPADVDCAADPAHPGCG